MSKPPISKYVLTMIQASKGQLHSRMGNFSSSPSLFRNFLSFPYSSLIFRADCIFQKPKLLASSISCCLLSFQTLPLRRDASRRCEDLLEGVVGVTLSKRKNPSFFFRCQ